MERIIKKITWTWKKVVGVILGALGIGTLTSCYGMPILDPFYNPDGVNVVFKGTVEGDIDEDGETEPVSGIEISSNYATTFTDSRGRFEILAYFPEKETSAVLYFDDIDDSENGLFESDKQIIKKPDNYHPYVVLDPDNKKDKPGIIDIGTITLKNK